MKRRCFLKTSFASGITVVAFPSIIIKPPALNKLKRIGLTTVVFRESFKPSDKNPPLTLKDIVNENFGLLADFGNYPGNFDQYEALERIAPYTRLISAKTKDFNESMEHISYDFGKCVDIFENANYKGIYSLEQWGKSDPDYDYEKITDWMIERVKDRI